jgi:chromosome segregation ATPase
MSDPIADILEVRDWLKTLVTIVRSGESMGSTELSDRTSEAADSLTMAVGDLEGRNREWEALRGKVDSMAEIVEELIGRVKSNEEAAASRIVGAEQEIADLQRRVDRLESARPTPGREKP